MQDSQDALDSIDLLELAKILIRHLGIILLAGVVGAAAVYGYFKFIVTPVYTAETQLYVNNNNRFEALNNVNINDINASQKLVDTYIVVLQNDHILKEVTARCGFPQGSEAAVRKMLTMKSINGTEVLSISATNESPELAAQLVNTLAELAPQELIRVVKAGSVEVISPAMPPKKPSGPTATRNGVIGGMLGVVVSALLVLALELLDTTVKNSEDIEKRYNVAMLGEIPDFHSSQKGGYQKYEK